MRERIMIAPARIRGRSMNRMRFSSRGDSAHEGEENPALVSTA
ncbi:hypothetical protein FDG2_2151 [Candidatus Protofrankia californiensis]|uniref:Uncharacterized protein n=1 Tax=Candidatus Protofrankia californiensis TaxID=1839754 RepID=A0A1C3NX21_9ACTN|nr:hypothetical protein FDG2_2151 [Candidatus Protofrankia californiensis]